MSEASNFVRIPLKSRSGEALAYALVDRADIPAIAGYRWGYWRHTNMVRARVGPSPQVQVLLHRVILGVTDRHVFVDHINGDRLDNRRCNLRFGTNQQNLENRFRANRKKGRTSRFLNVSWSSSRKRWKVAVKHLGKFYYEYHALELDAARAARAMRERLLPRSQEAMRATGIVPR